MAYTALQNRSAARLERDFHGAAVIGPDGREIPITEQMVAESLTSLEESWRNSHRLRATSSQG